MGPGCPGGSSVCPLSSSGQENVCFGVGLGLCDGRVKNRGWGWYSGQNETPSGQNEIPSGQFIRKVGKSALELGGGGGLIINSMV